MSSDPTATARSQSKKPSESAFKQQKLPAWQPILTAGTVLPAFFVIGIAFIPIGIIVLYFSDQVDERVIRYTDCNSTNPPFRSCAEATDNHSKPCRCSILFSLDTDFEAPVYLYYGLTNFYQNHRRYVKSRDDRQLLGKLSNPVSSDCQPFHQDPSSGLPVAPCGAIANSMFSDTLTLYDHNNESNVPLLKTGIAWPSDKEIKFKNPTFPKNETLKYAFRGYAKPENWTKNIWELDPDNPSNNGFENEDFIVWMRTAALPNFRKLYRRVDHSKSPYDQGLRKGNYSLIVDYVFQVKGFHGTKSAILSTTSILGAKNPFLGYAYITVGCLCLLVGIVFLIIHVKYGKTTGEVVNVTPTTSYQ